MSPRAQRKSPTLVHTQTERSRATNRRARQRQAKAARIGTAAVRQRESATGRGCTDSNTSAWRHTTVHIAADKSFAEEVRPMALTAIAVSLIQSSMQGERDCCFSGAGDSGF